MKKQLCETYSQQATHGQLCRWLSMPRSTSYYRSSGNKRGCKPSTHTPMQSGELVNNEQVVDDLIHEVFGQEFNRYGYQLSNEELRSLGYIINPKKTYRLMAENGLLLERSGRSKITRRWVKWRKIKDAKPLEYICMDIKYVYIHGARRNAYLLCIMDVGTRTVLGWSLRFSMKHTDVILCLHAALSEFHLRPEEIILRTDNGSQFIANGLRNYCKSHNLSQEFTHVATPEENAYVESLFSCIQREVINRYEFESLYHAREVFKRYFNWHNNGRRRHALKRKSPIEYWNTVFDCHPVKPPSALSGGFVKGDDTDKKIKNTSSLVLPLTNSERGLSLLNQDDKENVLNLFEKSVQEIGC